MHLARDGITWPVCYVRRMDREKKLISYGVGPWLDEPDEEVFEHAGLWCIVCRQPELGSLCGYVAVPPTHALHEISHEPSHDVLRAVLNALHKHGGITFSGWVDDLAFAPVPREQWAFGFHCAYGFDYMPGTDMLMRNLLGQGSKLLDKENYREWKYVRATVCALADDLAEFGRLMKPKAEVQALIKAKLDAAQSTSA